MILDDVEQQRRELEAQNLAEVEQRDRARAHPQGWWFDR